MSAIHNYIAKNKDANGALELKDDKTGETDPLEFVEMHQPIRYLKRKGTISLHRLPQDGQQRRIL